MTVEVGQQAPDFELTNQHGELVRLSDYRGSKNVMLVFYPWAFTSVCTGELCSIRDRIASFDNEATVTLAVSCDAKFSLRIFADTEGFTFNLLSDHWPHGATARAYGVFSEDKGAARRGTFIIDRRGMIQWSIVNEIPDARDVTMYEKVLAEL